jgi:hypothetical protein
MTLVRRRPTIPWSVPKQIERLPTLYPKFLHNLLNWHKASALAIFAWNAALRSHRQSYSTSNGISLETRSLSIGWLQP